MNIIKNFIKNIFDLFGYTVVNTIDYNHTNWEVNHYKTAYEKLEKSNTEFHAFVQNEVMPGWTKSDERCKDLLKQMNECTENWQKSIALTDKCIAYIQNLDDEQAKQLKQEDWTFNTIAKENYRHQLADMGVALDRLMGELVSAHGYTEKDIAECLGYYEESFGHGTPLYDQIQTFLPPFEWKYKTE